MDESDLDNTTATDLARLMGLGAGTDPQWQPEDLAEMLEHQLSAPLVYDLRDLDIRQEQYRRLMDTAQPPIHSFRDLFTHASPPLELLELVKEHAKISRDDPSSLIPASIASTLYYACLAVAQLRCGTQLTTMSIDSYRQGLRWTLDQPWINTQLNELFGQAWHQLQTT